MLKRMVFASCLILMSVNASAENKAFQVPLETGQTLKISGYKGIVEFVSSGDAQNIRINIQQTSPTPMGLSEEAQSALNNWGPYVENHDKAIEIRFREPGNREFWSQKGSMDLIPQFKIQVVGAAIPTEVYWWKGVISVRNWHNSLGITLNQGEVNITKCEGETKLYVQSGTVKVADHKGGIWVSSYDAKVDAQHIDGNVDVDNFSGQSHFDNVEGNLRLASFNGKSKINEIKGSVNFDLKVGSLDVEALDGALRGDNGDGFIKAQVIGTPDVRIRSQAGTVNLKVPRKYSAHLNVGSFEGELRVPGNIKIQRGPNMRFAVGRLNGGEKEGQIFARSQSGAITVNSAE